MAQSYNTNFNWHVAERNLDLISLKYISSSKLFCKKERQKLEKEIT